MRRLMRDRISISFTNKIDGTESVTLFSHSDGEGFLDVVKEYLCELQLFLSKETTWEATPLARLEPATVMVDFIKWITMPMEAEFEEVEEENALHIENNYYVGKDQNDGDNSDNGHHQIELSDYFPSKKRKEEVEKLEKEIHEIWEKVLGIDVGISLISRQLKHFINLENKEVKL